MDGQTVPQQPTLGLFSFPRSASPSGLSGLLSKPSKWFKSPSSGRSMSGTTEPRSIGVGSRRVSVFRVFSCRSTIGHVCFTVPPSRPFVLSRHWNLVLTLLSRSVFDLSLPKVGTLEPILSIPATPSSSRSLTPSKRVSGDLQSMSRRAWSKSADDLSNISGPERLKSPSLAPLGTELHDKISKYRSNRSDSLNSTVTPCLLVDGKPLGRSFTRGTAYGVFSISFAILRRLIQT